MREDALRDRRHQNRLRGRQCLRRVHARTRQCIHEPVRVVQQIQHRRNHCRSDHAANEQCHLLTPRCRANEPTCLQILQVVVRNRRNRDDGRRREQRESNPELAAATGVEQSAGLAHAQDEQRDEHHRDNADTRNRAGRRPHEPGHIPARRRHEKTEHHGKHHAADHQRRNAGERQRCVRKKDAKRHDPDSHANERQSDHPIRREILLSTRKCHRLAVRAARLPQRRKRGLHPVGHWFRERDERPDGGHADGSGADEAHLVLPKPVCECGDRLTIRIGRNGCEQWHRDSPAQHDPEQNRQARHDTNEISRADKRQ
ncbi:hypothetical protein PMO31116_03093 [Pandoraea morbifera]|uniref:Uncharacterized protein n=1 Tax=Pandoraea morbifera TaxID=2508300 RepID=A0A5E4W9F4_9BURK|nr:hypothetical protein PMO31116_03093 [Pandoraea morbifera]